MKKENKPLAEKTANNQSEDLTNPVKPGHEMTRRDAVIKVGKYAALTAATFLILSPKKAQATSAPTPGYGQNKNAPAKSKRYNEPEET